MTISLCEYCGERPGETNSRFWFPIGMGREEGYDEGGWVCSICEQELEEDHEEEMKELAAVYSPRRRPETSELYKYPRYGYEGDKKSAWFNDLDVTLCPRCKDQDIFRGDRVCFRCLAKINNDDFS